MPSKIYVFNLHYHSNICKRDTSATFKIKATSLNDAWFTVITEWLKTVAETIYDWELKEIEYVTEYEI